MKNVPFKDGRYVFWAGVSDGMCLIVHLIVPKVAYQMNNRTLVLMFGADAKLSITNIPNVRILTKAKLNIQPFAIILGVFKKGLLTPNKQFLQVSKHQNPEVSANNNEIHNNQQCHL